MVDYYKETGTNPHPDYKGSMMIRDTGTQVEFRIRAGSVNTYSYNMPYGWTINGSTGSSTKTYPTGKKWLFLRSWKVTESQDVVFRLGDTQTEGLGGPTTFSVYIDRGGTPGRPSKPSISNILHESAFVTFTDGDTGGLPITSRQIGYGINPTAPDMIVASDGSTTVPNLKPGTMHYFWARTRNAKGFSRWSQKTSARALGGSIIFIDGEYLVAVPYVKHANIWRPTLPYVKDLEVWKRTE